MNPRMWKIIALCAAGLLMIVFLTRACSTSDADPSSYIKKEYTRAANLDEDGIQAYVVPGKSPDEVASAISTAAKPLDRRTSSSQASSDGGNSVFLQYSKRIVGIFPHDGGSRVMLGDYQRAHSHWFVYIGGFWGSSPGYSGGGSGGRGGGVGGGK